MTEKEAGKRLRDTSIIRDLIFNYPLTRGLYLQFRRNAPVEIVGMTIDGFDSMRRFFVFDVLLLTTHGLVRERARR